MDLYCISIDDWENMIIRIKEGECVPFLGAGASLGPGLPTARTLAKAIAQECHYPGQDKGDLLRISQYFATVRDPYSVRKFIKANIEACNAKPGIIHKTLAALPFSYVLTTNYDDLMEKAFEDIGKSPSCEVYERYSNKKKIVEATSQKPLVYKLHGSVDRAETMIATEDDVIDFLSCLLLSEPPLPSLIRGLFKEYSILFIGYGLKDWNVRSMFRALRGRGQAPSDICSFAIQKRPEDPGEAKIWDKSVMYFETKERLRCFDMDAIDFVKELKRRYEGFGENDDAKKN